MRRQQPSFRLWCDECKVVTVNPSDLTIVFGPAELCGPHAGARFTCGMCTAICWGLIGDDHTAATLIGRGATVEYVAPPARCSWDFEHADPMTPHEAASHAADIWAADVNELWAAIEKPVK